MTATINYDRPVKNLIDALSATGHVNHSSWRKTSVTLHHNAGKLTHEGVLNVWKTRPASAHFDVDAAGAVAQYVKADEYAWATGSTDGNRYSISIEMANSTLSPDWQVAEVTWKSAARLAGWLFAHVIGARPSSSNLFYHKHWYATSCAGPYMDKVYGLVLAEAQRAYDSFRLAGSGGSGGSTPIGPVTGGGSTPIPQEDDMPYTPDQLQENVAIGVLGAQIGRTEIAPGKPLTVGVALDRIYSGSNATLALLSKLDPAVLADAIGKSVAAALPQGSAASRADIEAAIRSVLGSLDEAGA